MEWVLEIVLVLMLAVTLFHALRLERALGVLKRDRTQLEELVGEFNASTQAAEGSIARLHEAADGAGRQIGRHVESAGRLKDDLVFLVDRGERLADRLDLLVREGRMLEPQATGYSSQPQATGYSLADTQPAEPEWHDPPPRTAPRAVRPDSETVTRATAADEASPRVRSQAERDLMKALRQAR